MTRSEFRTISELCAESEILINVDAGNETSRFEDYLESLEGAGKLDYMSNVLKILLQTHYKERFSDGANIIDEYRDVCIYAANREAEFNEDAKQMPQIWFWEAAEELLVESEHKDEEQ